MKSVFKQGEGECFICTLLSEYTVHNYLEEHHIFEGTANRKKSEKYGMKVRLCLKHHRGDQAGNSEAVHTNMELNQALKRIGQVKFEESHTREEFRKEFGKSWL